MEYRCQVYSSSTEEVITGWWGYISELFWRLRFGTIWMWEDSFLYTRSILPPPKECRHTRNNFNSNPSWKHERQMHDIFIFSFIYFQQWGLENAYYRIPSNDKLEWWRWNAVARGVIQSRGIELSARLVLALRRHCQAWLPRYLHRDWKKRRQRWVDTHRTHLAITVPTPWVSLPSKLERWKLKTPWSCSLRDLLLWHGHCRHLQKSLGYLSRIGSTFIQGTDTKMAAIS